MKAAEAIRKAHFFLEKAEEAEASGGRAEQGWLTEACIIFAHSTVYLLKQEYGARFGGKARRQRQKKQHLENWIKSIENDKAFEFFDGYRNQVIHGLSKPPATTPSYSESEYVDSTFEPSPRDVRAHLIRLQGLLETFPFELT